MYEEKIFSGNTIQEVAKIFSEEISRQYLKHLKFWQITSIDDNDEFWKLEEKIKREPSVVQKNVFNKILEIMQKPEANKKFYKKRLLLFRSKNIIIITSSSDFYNDLLTKGGIQHTIPKNIKYILNSENLTIVKKYI